MTCGPLFEELKNQVDIYLLQETWLYDCQLHLINDLHEEYMGIGKAVDTGDPIPPIKMPRGHGGVAIMWKKSLDPYINYIQGGNNRILCIELRGEILVLIISVYLPCRGSAENTLEFQDCLDQMREIIKTHEDTHQILIGGDMNENAVTFTESPRGRYLKDFMAENNLITYEMGITYKHTGGHLESAIDYFFIQKTLEERIVGVKRKDNLIANVSDHIPIYLEMEFKYNGEHTRSLITV